MDLMDLNFQDWNPHDPINTSFFKESPKRPTTPEVDFKNALNDVEINGGNGIEINWDKYEVSYDCPRCLKKIFKKPYNQGSQMMWANHFTPIFNRTSHSKHQQSDDDETVLEHISTCAFYYFQSPVSKFDIDYLDAVEKRDFMESLKPCLIDNFSRLNPDSQSSIFICLFIILLL